MPSTAACACTAAPAATQPKEYRVQLPESAARILPAFLQPKTAVESSKGVLILAKSGLRKIVRFVLK